MMQTMTPLATIPEVLEDLCAGKMVVLVDDEDRENEGDLVIPAQFITPDVITFMLTHARGYLCLCLTESDCDRLDLPPQSPKNTSVRGTPFTISIDGHPNHGFTTGVSAHERAKCIQMAIDPAYGADEFVRPGHINPLRSRDGGVLVRIGQTEGSVDLCRLAGLRPQAVLIEIMRDDGEMARRPDLEAFCAKHELKMCSVAQIIEHRIARESLIKRMEPISGTLVRTAFGEFNLIAYDSAVDALPQLALTVGGIGALDGSGEVEKCEEPTLIRMHRRDLLGDVFHDVNALQDGKTPHMLHAALRRIQDEGRGAVVYMRPEGTGDGLSQRLTKMRRPNGATSDISSQVPMHLREFGIGGQILRDLGLSRLRLLTNHPKELPGLDAFGLEIVEQVDLH